MKLIRHIQRCNKHNPHDYVPFVVDGELVGRFRHAFEKRLADWPDVFDVSKCAVSLHEKLQGYEPRSSAIDAVLRELLACGEHLYLPYLLDEMYAVTANRREEALFEIDRSASALFGIRAFGQHLNGFVRKRDGMHMWLGQRAADKGTFPGKLDHLVAGGLPVGISLERNLHKECREEAGIGDVLARLAIPVGAVSYNVDTEQGFKYDTLYCYDLELPHDFVPRCTDGEVDSFQLLPIEQVMRIVLETDDFKPNCNLVMIDFLLRHGFIGPAHEEYLALMTGLHPAMRIPDHMAGEL
ncbi:MAG: DUF4743 domain-containing protein [Thiotrichales bacterium]|nr:MAG: DUF4743 domain-containing protein [Thiotrichales bacterium]